MGDVAFAPRAFRLVVLTLAVLAAGVPVRAFAQLPPGGQREPTRVSIRNLDMLSPRNGLGITTSLRIVQTTNGALTWRAETPSALAVVASCVRKHNGAVAITALTAQEVWVFAHCAGKTANSRLR